jgi:hypothetical protein
MACKILHIGVFFDGTGNNKAMDSGDGSQSNIAKLSELYRHNEIWIDAQRKEHKSVMIYKNGVGTYDTKAERDSNSIDRKYDKGGGGGGAKRINDAIDRIVKLLKAHSTGSGDGTYVDRIIDVFGFSRGAAEARDFINTFNKRNYKEFKEKKVRFNFVGIYDTVGSFGEAGNNINNKPKNPEQHSESDRSYIKVANGSFGMNDGIETKTVIAYDPESAEIAEGELKKDKWSLTKTEMGPPYTMTFQRVSPDFEPYNFNLHAKSAETIIHMVAHDEVRKNFPLSSLNPIGGAHVEWVYTGVHSDVGGGYAPMEIEPHSYELGTYKSFSEADKAIAQAKKSHSSEWKFETNLLSGASMAGIGLMFSQPCYVVASRQRKITNDLTYVTLHRMHEQALKEGVPFKPIIKFRLPPLVVEYNTYTKDNPSEAMSFKEMKILREKYSHHSAVDQDDIDTHYDGHTEFVKDVWKNDSPDGGDGNNTRYIQKKAQREIYPNVASKAILPA